MTDHAGRPTRRLLSVRVENACRSRTAAAFARRDAGPGGQVYGAGSDAADEFRAVRDAIEGRVRGPVERLQG